MNYYVYGGSNNTNLGVGDNVVQTDNNQTIEGNLKEFSEQLKNLNVPIEEVDSIKEIIKSKGTKESKLSKAMTWVGQLSTKMITKGVELKLPEIIEATGKMIEKMSS